MTFRQEATLLDKKLLVLGESYMNLQMKTNVAQKDETLTYGSSYGFHPYGEGAATAISAAKLGGDCIFCTKLGDDNYGKRLKKYYNTCGLHLSSKNYVEGVQTGLTAIIYNDTENAHTYVVKGANLHFTKQDIDNAFELAPDMFILPQEDILSQLKESELETVSISEVPQPSVQEEAEGEAEELNIPEDFSETIMFSNDEITAELDAIHHEPKNLVMYAAKKAIDQNIDLVVHYNSYTSKLPLHELDGIKILVISDKMLFEESGVEPGSIDKTLRALIPLSAKVKAKYYIVQQGNDTSFVYDGKYYEIITLPPILKAKAKQETPHMHGTYIGALATRFLETRDIIDSCKYASVVSILTHSKFGCLDHVPSKHEVEDFTSEQ